MTIEKKTSMNEIQNQTNTIQLQGCKQTSKWRGRATVLYKNAQLDDLNYTRVENSSKAAKIFELLLKKTHVSFNVDTQKIFIRKNTVEKALKKINNTYVALLQKTTHHEVQQEAILPTINKLHEKMNKLLTEAVKRNKDLLQVKTKLAGVKVIMIALREESGEYNIYLRPSSKNKGYEKALLGEGTYKKVITVANLSKKSLMAMAKPTKNSQKVATTIQDAEKEYTISTTLKEKKVSHINTIHSFKTFTRKSKNSYFMISDLASKGTLSNHLDEAKNHPKKRAKWALQICESAHDMHEKGNMLHLDIKPDNILVNEKDEIQLADFGLSASLDGVDKKQKRGTPMYMAPEIFLGNKKVHWDPNPQYDAWAVGLVLFELKYGEIPNRMTMPCDFAQKALKQEVVEKSIQEAISENLHKKLTPKDPYDEIIFGLLQPNPKNRISLTTAIDKLKTVQKGL